MGSTADLHSGNGHLPELMGVFSQEVNGIPPAQGLGMKASGLKKASFWNCLSPEAWHVAPTRRLFLGTGVPFALELLVS